MAWRSTLLQSVKRNARLPNAKYVQLVRRSACPRWLPAQACALTPSMLCRPGYDSAERQACQPDGGVSVRRNVLRCVSRARLL
jgi:hypothetical protein